jgi:hypothetical protein
MPFGMFQALGNALSAKKSNKALTDVWNKDPSYTKNPLVGQQFDLAKQMFYGRMVGGAQEERNIYGNNANFNAQVGRNSSDGSQSLALAAAGQGQTNQAFSNLQLKEQQNKYGMLSNLNNAYGQMIGEDDKVYNDQVRRFGDYASIKGAQIQNKAGILTGVFNGLNSDFNDAMQIFGMAKGGGFGGGSNKQMGGNMPITSWAQLQGFPQIDYSQVGSSYPQFKPR